MRIGFDLDGVLADLHRAFVEEALRLYPEMDTADAAAPQVGASPGRVDADSDDAGSDAAAVPDPVEEVTEARTHLSHRQSMSVWRRLYATTDFWESLHEIESGAIARIAAMAEKWRWEVIFLTSRPFAPGRTVQRQSQRWLERQGFPSPSLFVVQGSRGKIAESLQLDVFVDDRPENCLDIVLESKARAVLIWRAEMDTLPAAAKRMGIGVAATVGECLDTIEAAETEAKTPTDLMGRLRKLLGFSGRGRL